jgi:hypothetical protein
VVLALAHPLALEQGEVDDQVVRRGFQPVAAAVVVSAGMGEVHSPVAVAAAAAVVMTAAAAAVHPQASTPMVSNPETIDVAGERSALRPPPLVGRSDDSDHRIEGCLGQVLAVVGRAVMNGGGDRKGLVFVEEGEDRIGGIAGTLMRREGVVVGMGPAVGWTMIVVVVFGRTVCDSEVEGRLSDTGDEIAGVVAVVEVGIGRALDRWVVVNLDYQLEKER